jgi:hypothetical protein
MGLEQLVGNDEIVGGALAEYLSGDDGNQALIQALLQGDGGGVDPDLLALLTGDVAIGAAARSKPTLASLPSAHGNYSRTARLAGANAVVLAALRGQQAREAVAEIASRKAIGVRQREYTIAGQMPVGFTTGDVATGDSAIVNITPPVIFSPNRLLVPETIAPGWTLNDVSIGLRKCMLTSQPLPAESFSQNSVNTGWDLPTLQIGQTMSMTWQNHGQQTAELRGTWQGKYADG